MRLAKQLETEAIIEGEINDVVDAAVEQGIEEEVDAAVEQGIEEALNDWWENTSRLNRQWCYNNRTN